MISVTCSTAAEVEVMSQLIAGTRFKLGPVAPDCLDDVRYAVAVVIDERSPSLAGTAVDMALLSRDDAPVTYSEAAAIADVSKATIGRLVRAGRLVKVGRRVTVSSLRAHLTGELSNG